MRINTDAQMETARKVYRLYDGDWGEARAAGTVDEEGVLVIPHQSNIKVMVGAYAS